MLRKLIAPSAVVHFPVFYTENKKSSGEAAAPAEGFRSLVGLSGSAEQVQQDKNTANAQAEN